MATARDIMTPDCQCVGEQETLVDAARKMRDLDVGALPICGTDDRLKGVLTDRDIVVRCVAEAVDARNTTVGQLAQGEGDLVWVDADASVDEVVQTMSDNQVRRVPVLENRRLVGIISQADVARALPEKKAGAVVGEISQER
ncbi:CBS domain-containing protein [Streptoalloteichus tenebrarius]|uniref:CBS domain-containing protein n=1 Tax=Streptoalloteichus tenebrarius (strain ATCC 17920 / DSM 40477 / JCM 4838 / CBS 697.72 / NBRC 16177 / NCIMB 11028 / NRRL B-12390 / A12253. 1 / ISP 5477) TaxID=1933 RepID=A0ABT1HQD0_STRSD|nr:CBS domain-containing protein [Streptoalloteichus tenebrarius]MCP2257710.1 CBS domain-containing protein [Streptoalloteichus tenebrarius]BFE99936.1 CBS domain-containing protein [Streptoalloteichus tenebrarius]